MRTLKKRLRYSLFGAVLCAVSTIILLCISAWHAAVLSAALTSALGVFAFRFAESYHTARLITENPIFNVDVASVAQADTRGTAQSCVQVVVSGFGILLNEKPYKFGHGGVNLTATQIARESIMLSFGDDEKAYCVRLLHGIPDKAAVYKLTERLRYETGVIADVSGW